MLNTRCSILAAANPIHGSYKSFETFGEQVELQTTILSRFDCIFIVKDLKSKDYDKRIADHILGLHIGEKSNVNKSKKLNEFIRNYIQYAKQHFHPRLTERASKEIRNFYVTQRKNVKIRQK